MKESAGEKAFEFTIDNLETLSIRNNWCSWCVNVFVSDATGDWNSCGTGLLSFLGKRKSLATSSKISTIKELKTDVDGWDPNMFTLQVRSKKNLANNNKGLQIDPELKKKLSMDKAEDLILHCELKKATQCALSELVIMWYQEDIQEHLALSFLSAVTIVESWEIMCHITGTSLQDSFKINLKYLDYILASLESKDEDIIKKKLTVAVFCSKVDTPYPELDSFRELLDMYQSLNKDSPDYVETANKIHRIVMLLLESSQLDIILYVLNNSIFYETLDLLEDMHRHTKTLTCHYREYFMNQTRFINYFNFSAQMIDTIQLRFKILFLKDYVLCDHPKEELISYLNSISEIPNASIFLQLTENNAVFGHIIDNLDDNAEQFLTEFFSLYKALSAESKLLFAVTFFMKNLHLKYIEKIVQLLTSDDVAHRLRIVNLVELLGLILASKKENATKLFKSEADIEGDSKISFSFILNMLLLDQQESVRDSGLNILSVMTESVNADRSSNVALLNSYLLPQMARFVSSNTDDLPWHYCASFLKVLSLVMDKDNPANNSFFVTNLVNYKILENLPGLYKMHKAVKIFRICFLQLVSAIIFLTETQITDLITTNKYLELVWDTYQENSRRKNIVYSIALKIFNDIESRKLTAYIEYFGLNFGAKVKAGLFEANPYVQRIMQQYRKLHADPNDEELMQGKFSDASPDASQERTHTISPTPGVISGTNEQIRQNLEQILIGDTISQNLPEGMKLETMPANPNRAQGDHNSLGKRVRNGE